MVLTWPKKRNGKRKVKPLHIQDWNPSAETENLHSQLETGRAARLIPHVNVLWTAVALNDWSEFQQTQLSAHPLWGPADSSPPGLEVCTSSRSGSNTGGTGGSLEPKLMPKLRITTQSGCFWWKATDAELLFGDLTKKTDVINRLKRVITYFDILRKQETGF